MHAWEAIQNSLDYIEDNLPDDITIETLAGVAALSPYYFQRLFRRLVKRPANEYVKLRRLAKSAEALKSKEQLIMHVAFDYGFSDHANFTRAFKEAYGITPEEYRNNPIILNQFVKPDLRLKYLSVEEDAPLVADGIVVEVTRRRLDDPRAFLGIAGEVPDTELTRGRTTGIATIGLIWNEFHLKKNDIVNLLPEGNEIGVLYPGTAREGCCTYLAGAEALDNGNANGYASYSLPCGDYIVCCFEAENFAELIGSAVYKASSFMNTWVKKHRLTCGNFVAEMYYGTKPEANYMELWLPLGTRKTTPTPKRTWDKANGIQKPSLDTISGYVNNPLWAQLCSHIEDEYQSKPVLEYSRCSMQYGWNVKYKKAGRTLCTLYPMEGHFVALVVIGTRERPVIELQLPTFTEYLQRLYHETETGMGQKWLMINVTDEAILYDLKQCIAIRRGAKKKRNGGK